MKWYECQTCHNKERRTPHGVRGLKWMAGGRLAEHEQSHPARGAWIEIMPRARYWRAAGTSHPARGAWIEIAGGAIAFGEAPVAPRTGCVD